MMDKDKQEMESKIFQCVTNIIAEYETKTGKQIEEVRLEFILDDEGEKPRWSLIDVDAVVARS